jgi:hypothetical protein
MYSGFATTHSVCWLQILLYDKQLRRNKKIVEIIYIKMIEKYLEFGNYFYLKVPILHH